MISSYSVKYTRIQLTSSLCCRDIRREASELLATILMFLEYGKRNYTIQQIYPLLFSYTGQVFAHGLNNSRERNFIAKQFPWWNQEGINSSILLCENSFLLDIYWRQDLRHSATGKICSQIFFRTFFRKSQDSYTELHHEIQTVLAANSREITKRELVKDEITCGVLHSWQ